MRPLDCNKRKIQSCKNHRLVTHKPRCLLSVLRGLAVAQRNPRPCWRGWVPDFVRRCSEEVRYVRTVCGDPLASSAALCYCRGGIWEAMDEHPHQCSPSFGSEHRVVYLGSFEACMMQYSVEKRFSTFVHTACNY